MNAEQTAAYGMNRENRRSFAAERDVAIAPESGTDSTVTGDAGLARIIADALSDLTDAISLPRSKRDGH